MAAAPGNRGPGPNALLFIALGAYALVDLVVVYLAAIGALGPSLDLLTFLTFVPPATGTALVLLAQFSIPRRPFHPLAVAGFVLAMLAAGFLNFLAMEAASAAV